MTKRGEAAATGIFLATLGVGLVIWQALGLFLTGGSSVLAAAVVVTTLACVLLGTGRVVRRAWLADWPGRARAALWGTIPAFVGGTLGYLDATGQSDFLGFLFTLVLACAGSMIAVGLWIPRHTRDAIRTVPFELTAALVWAYFGTATIASMITEH